MKPFASKLLAVAAALTLSAAYAQTSEWSGENESFDMAAGPAFEENFPASDEPDVALGLDLPADYFGEVTLPPMMDFDTEEPALMLASLDPTETP